MRPTIMLNSIINIYCDESHPMQNDGQDFMVIGCLICHKNKYRNIKKNIQKIKRTNGLDLGYEFKWQKINKKRLSTYIELIDYISKCEDIKIKINIALGKRLLKFYGKKHNYELWYNKMYYYMLKNYIRWHKEDGSPHSYRLFIDRKDTHSSDNYSKIASNLNKFFRIKNGFVSKACDSAEFLLIQCIDVIIGAVSYYYRKNYVNKNKTFLMRHIMNTFNVSFDETTKKNEDKMSIFVWKPEIR